MRNLLRVWWWKHKLRTLLGAVSAPVFIPFTESFTSLSEWTTVGSIAAVAGRLQVANATASAYVTAYVMEEIEGSRDLVADCYYSGNREHQFGFLMDATLAAKSDYYRSTVTGKGYNVRISTSQIELNLIDGSQSNLKAWSIIGWSSGDRLGVRIAFAANGDMTVSALRNGAVVSGGTHVIAAASLLSGRGSKIGLCAYANIANTTEFDNYSYEESP